MSPLRHPPRLRLLNNALDVIDGVAQCAVGAFGVALRLLTKVFQTSDQIVLQRLVFLSLRFRRSLPLPQSLLRSLWWRKQSLCSRGVQIGHIGHFGLRLDLDALSRQLHVTASRAIGELTMVGDPRFEVAVTDAI